MKLAFPMVALLVRFPALAWAGDPLPAPPPAEIVRRTVAHETEAAKGTHLHFMFRDEKKTHRLSQTKLMVETEEATAGLLLARNGRPLTPAEREREWGRLENYVHNPQELNKKRKQEREDEERTERILRALPEAFEYQEVESEPARSAKEDSGEELVRLDFRPNPNYSPPSRVEQVLTGMQGHLLINRKENRLVQIDGTLGKEVSFGWGVLGHLDRGGRFFVEQADVGGQWEVTRMELSFTGRVLLVKKLTIESSDTFSDFRPVPSALTFAQGVELLEKEARSLSTEAMSQPAAQGKSESQKKEHRREQKEEDLCCDR
jgi:hypothetical protein